YAWSTFRKRVSDKTYDSVLIGWTADNLDPDNFFRPVLTCDSKSNRSNWCDENYDELVYKAIQETEQEKRIAIYQKALGIINTELPLVPIAHAVRYQPYRSHINGININPIGGISFIDVEKAQ
ncbi:MAG: ABC transporter substrate-binding protein, partial [Glaciecola sp.]